MKTTGKIKEIILSAGILLAMLFVFGTPAYAGLNISPNPVTFSGQAVGSVSAPIAVSLFNNGKRAINIAGVSASPLQFAVSGSTSATTLNPGQGITVFVTFAPTAVQSYSGTLVFQRGNHSTVSVTLNGTGTQSQSLTQPPSITTQPSSKTVTAGQTAAFTVSATGTTPMTYQWSKSGVAISGATSPSYTTPATTTSDSGSQFTVVLSNSAGSATSTAATLTVNAAAVAPSITTQPLSKTVTAGQTATFTVSCTGTAPMNYQWSKGGVAISGATSYSYTTPATTPSDSGSQFTVVVSNNGGNTTSAAATLTVNAAAVAPSITTQPLSKTVTAGQTATFTVSATGTTPMTYQWSKSGVAISGATSPSYTTPATTTSDNGSQFTVVLSNSAGSATSTAATLTVNAAAVAPSITTQPLSKTVTAGQTATFTVAATGTAPMTYQWNNGGVAISGATSSSYTTPATTTSDSSSQFTVVLSNSAGSATSTAATLTVNAAAVAPSITTQPLSKTVTAGQTATFTVAATGTTPMTYQWNKGGAAISGATSSSYTTPATTTSDSGSQFTVVLSNSAGSATSTAATLTVNNADTTPPTVSISSPASGATVSGTVSVTANASDNVAVASVQFRVDGNNVGSPDTTAPYTFSLNTTTLSNASHTLTAVATDTSNNSTTSAGVSVTVNNVVSSGATGPLVQSSSNPHYFVNPAGQGVLLSGSQTWNDMQDTDMSSSPAAVDFNAYVNFLKSHGHNVTIVWHKDLPTYCNWGPGGTWTMSPFPWLRTGVGNASDGKPQFDLTQFNQAYFDRLLARVSQLQQNGIYAVVELFDGLGLSNNRCSVDGYPFTGGNNVNNVSDGGGTNSMTMSAANTITGYQDAYVKKVIDTLNSQPNVLWEISEEAPDNSTWWEGHMISLIRSYEAGKPLQHPIGYPSLNVSGASDSTLYNSNADWVAPFARISPTSSCGSGTPACKVNINDSDHSYFGMWNDSAQVNRNYLWENFANGDSVMFMDPYLIEWPSGNRNLCSNPIINGVCGGVDTRWNNFRDNMGYMLSYANTKLDLVKMTPQASLSSTGFCLADNVAAGAEYLVYAPNGGSFTVNLSATTHVLNVEWLNPSSGAISSGPLVTGGATRTFTPPFSGDAVLYLVDSNGHN